MLRPSWIIGIALIVRRRMGERRAEEADYKKGGELRLWAGSSNVSRGEV